MKVSFAILPALLLCALSQSAHAGFGVGIGYPYGGVVGVQYTVQQQQHLWSGAVGLVGTAVSYQYVLDTAQQHSAGIVLGTETITSEKGFAAFQYNYYSAGAANAGWVLGLNLGQRREDAGSFYASSSESNNKTLLGLHVGYRF
jgi:hypothetical protein